MTWGRIRVRSASWSTVSPSRVRAACSSGPIDRVVGRLDGVVVDQQRLDRVAGLGDRRDPLAPDHGVLDQVDAAGAAQLAPLELLVVGGHLVAHLGADGRGVLAQRARRRAHRLGGLHDLVRPVVGLLVEVRVVRLVLALPALPQPGGPGESACQPRPGVGQPADGLVQVVGVVDVVVAVDLVGVVGVVGVDLAGHHLGHHRRLGLLDERLVHGRAPR